MKYAKFVAAVVIGSVSQSEAVIINQTLSQVSKQANITNNGPIITDQLPTHIIQKNETSNFSAAVNESKQVGCTRGENDASPSSVAVAALV